jgi:predicted amidophosphoribosyltransferase
MAWVEAVRRWAGHGLDLLYPPRCALCGAEPGGTVPGTTAGLPSALPTVCDACRSRLAHDRPRCGICAAPVTGLAEPEACPRCRRHRDLDGIAVVGGYEGDLRARVLEAKHPAGRLVAGGLAAVLVDRHRERILGWAVDLVVPVPMHWLRRSVRGMSAADELARGVAAGLGLPRAAALRRRRATRMQNELPWEERRGNVGGAFAARHAVAGRRLLLVDDVTTTGATLAACRVAATAAGAAAVYAAVVARADRDGES